MSKCLKKYLLVEYKSGGTYMQLIIWLTWLSPFLGVWANTDFKICKKNPDVEMQGFSHKKIDSSQSYEEVGVNFKWRWILLSGF